MNEDPTPSALAKARAEAAALEYPPEVWPRLYAGVLALLLLQIVAFAVITSWFS